MRDGQIGEYVLLWVFRMSVKRLHRRGFWMYIRQNSRWISVDAYSLSKSGPPVPQIIVSKTDHEEVSVGEK